MVIRALFTELREMEMALVPLILTIIIVLYSTVAAAAAAAST